MIAIPWLVLVTTGSATQTGLVAAAEITPLVMLKALGGPLIDRVGPAPGGDHLRPAQHASSVGLIPLLHHLGDLLTFPAAARAGRGRRRAARARRRRQGTRSSRRSSPRRRGAPRAGHRAGRRRSSARRRCSAPPSPAGSVATVGAANAVAVDAASFGVCAVVLGWSPPRTGAAVPEPVDRAATSRRRRTSRELREGWDFLRRDPVLIAHLRDGRGDQPARPGLVGGAAAGLGPRSPAPGSARSAWSSRSGRRLGARLAGAPRPAAPGCRASTTYLVAFLVTGLPRFVLFALGVPLWAGPRHVPGRRLSRPASSTRSSGP